MPGHSRGPKCVLILSADMGEGHNAAAALLRATMLDLWPGCHVAQIDTMKLRGARFAATTRAAYELEIRRAPWLYQRTFDAIIDHPAFAEVGKGVVSEFFGRPLLRLVRRLQPDLMVSTFPLGNGAMHWVRSAAGFPATTAAFIPGFDVHPFWVWPGIDAHLVVHPALVQEAVRFGAGGDVRVMRPLVRPEFHDRSRDAARQALGVRMDRLVILATGGSWGVGSIWRAVRALADAPRPVHVLAVCGTNEVLRRELAGSGIERNRLLTFGFVKNMPDLMAAADLVLTNGAGVTVLEALVTGRPVIAFDPLPGHGRLGSRMLEQAGVAVVCLDERALLESIGRLANGDGMIDRLRANAAVLRGPPALADELVRLAALEVSRGLARS